MTDNLVQRLLLWEEVFPEDLDKEEGHLYYEAADCIEALTTELVEVLGELIYLRKYAHLGGRWEANDSKDVWYDLARNDLNARKDNK